MYIMRIANYQMPNYQNPMETCAVCRVVKPKYKMIKCNRINYSAEKGVHKIYTICEECARKGRRL